MAEKVIPYDRTIVPQETGWYCGPASCQVVLNSRGIRVAEKVLAAELEKLEGNVGWDDQDGTDHIRQITAVLNGRLPAADYAFVEMPNDPPSDAQRAKLWSSIVSSIDAGYGVVANIVAPPSNYPRAVQPSTIHPAYGGGTVFHYFSVMGYSSGDGARRVWIADSGFSPFGYWMSFAQLCTLIPPKGYTFSTVKATAPKPDPKPPAAEGMTAAVLAEAMGCPLSRASQMLDGMIGAMRAAQITTPLRAAHWCAQIGHESAGLVYMEEIADGSAYNGRADLGNVHPGDGPRFKGSGPIQLTGRHNFGKFSEWAFAKRYVTSPTYFVDHPDLVRSDPRWGFLAASWYWTVARPNLNALADADNLDGVTRAINGGTNGIDDRRARLARCKRLGAKLLPPSTSGGLTMSASEELTKRFPSRSIYRHSDALIDTMAGFILNLDARIHEQWVREQAEAGDRACIDLVRREAAKGDAASRACLARIEGAQK